MYLFYVDESGSVSDPSNKYFVLAGVAVYETQTHWVEKSLHEMVVADIDKTAPHDIELHGSPIRAGKIAPWRAMKKAQRNDIIKKALDVALVKQRNPRLFACVVEKAAIQGHDAVEFCFEQLVIRFDQFLQRAYIKEGTRQRGIMLFDESSTERRIQTLARDFKYNGHANGKTRNFAEVPVFLDSRATRLIQLADLVSYSIYRYFEHKDSSFWDLIKDRFDEEGGVQHGLLVVDSNNPLPVTGTQTAVSTSVTQTVITQTIVAPHATGVK